ncbi:MAG: 16S rRNA (cytidine(1402)-2'-O)-methyltransferase [Desulfobacula sp.]|jgi:16S rRNA (cytidine1402-2'-O)-methyltransferase|uniref:16S rRNA (cytidine(1402)-2'-O)-methyltransferase n=1 Tax=Desulfobacula sp. TaxID=2593537 RepID=UPI001DF28BA9|nr:16S rRNA (cytidine(1402)-2'-O)-methyltransferase [Desulfobacula sp.]MBT3485229.1 16S rRNA (cytidine(1402)-2'-O)-methyltransferase [Desulfobacula sp.]MBT3804765.1 16S rRNA (cytidine(1402)-2'-O)-methyltransferase [Desulfobacula sp.]MBT4025242.1 16S rRNA (cytidine(1402)-2'-O)-methyltransferase [Desulfobacula sp.]MBT4200114.1 16S rRNA (cytidine(1402)-2'-O)-methyltransferase [Desulfobacula sp.]
MVVEIDTPNSVGTLYIVATPVGNLEDITFRAVKRLKQVDLIAAEDTRHSRKLLSHYGIDTKLVSCHEHNEINRTPQFIAQLKKGLDIALISDAGTPSISDPGYKLVAAVAKENLSIIPIPGCSAAIAGLSVSGLPTDSFLFLGFLPKKQQKQNQALEAIVNQSATLIIYESPRRIKLLIENILKILGDRNACLAREITKLHEEYIRGSLSEILKALEEKEVIKGECSLFVQGQLEEKPIDKGQLENIVCKRLATTDLGTSDLARQISGEFKLSKKKVYDLILKLNRE